MPNGFLLDIRVQKLLIYTLRSRDSSEVFVCVLLLDSPQVRYALILTTFKGNKLACQEEKHYRSRLSGWSSRLKKAPAALTLLFEEEKKIYCKTWHDMSSHHTLAQLYSCTYELWCFASKTSLFPITKLTLQFPLPIFLLCCCTFSECIASSCLAGKISAAVLFSGPYLHLCLLAVMISGLCTQIKNVSHPQCLICRI